MNWGSRNIVKMVNMRQEKSLFYHTVGTMYSLYDSAQSNSLIIDLFEKAEFQCNDIEGVLGSDQPERLILENAKVDLM